jgi:hypothetical protein
LVLVVLAELHRGKQILLEKMVLTRRLVALDYLLLQLAAVAAVHIGTVTPPTKLVALAVQAAAVVVVLLLQQVLAVQALAGKVTTADKHMVALHTMALVAAVQVQLVVTQLPVVVATAVTV